MTVAHIEDMYPLSPMQQGMLFHSLYAPTSGVYVTQSTGAIHSHLNILAFERAWQRVIDRHPILRTAFVWEDLDEPVQVVCRGVELPLEHQDWRGLSPVEREERLERFLQAERARGFELSQAPLMRLALIRMADRIYQFVWSHHHVLLDGWSLPLLIQELFTLYEAFCQGYEIHLEPSRPYKDYIAWLQQQDISEAESFWRQTLKGFTAPTALVQDRADDNELELGETHGSQYLQLSIDATTALQTLAQRHHLTLNTLLQGVVALFLSRYSGEDDVVFGTVVSGRPVELTRIESMIGLFINTLPTRVRVSPGASLLSWLKQLQQQQTEMRRFEYSPLIDIQRWSEVPRGLPLFETLYVFENYPVSSLESKAAKRDASVDIRAHRIIEKANYPLVFVTGPGTQLSLGIEYDRRRFDDATIAQIQVYFQSLLDAIIADPEQSLSMLPAFPRRVISSVKISTIQLDELDELSRRSNLTVHQYLIWIGQQLQPGLPIYKGVRTFTVSSEIHPEHFQKAFQTVVNSSDALRTVIEEIDGVPQQRIITNFPYDMTYLDFSHHADPQTELQAWVWERSQVVFDFEARLFDSVLIKTDDQLFVWYFAFHHIILDGWSLSLILQRLSEFYQHALKGQLEVWIDLPAFRDYIAYEQAYRQSSQYLADKTYWQRKLAGEIAPLTFYGKVPHKQTSRVEKVYFDLGEERSHKLRALARRDDIFVKTLDVTLFNMYAAMLFTYLYRISGNRRLSIGTPAHNRRLADFKETIGLLMEVHPLQIQIEEGETFLSLIHKIAAEAAETLRHSQCGIGNVHKRDEVIMNYIMPSSFQLNDVPAIEDVIQPTLENDSLDLRIRQDIKSGVFSIDFTFHCDVFDEQRRRQASRHFLQVVDAFLEDSAQSIHRVNILSREEQKRILGGFNQTKTQFPQDATLAQLIEAQVQKTPEKLALVFEDQSITYGQLNDKANQLARFLQTLGVGPEVRVGICVARSPEMVMGLLGILKAGGAYVPMDPDSPRERLTFILQDAMAPVLLTQERFVAQLPEHHAHVVCLDTAWERPGSERNENPERGVRSKNLAYVIYTSGSTGEPKGVMVSHQSVVNHNVSVVKQYRLNASDRVLQFATLSFDAAVEEIFPTLMIGATLVLRSDGLLISGPEMLQLIAQKQLTVLNLPTVYWHEWVSELSHGQQILPASLRLVVLGGDKASAQRFVSWNQQGGLGISLINTYGPTETTIISTAYEPDMAEKEREELSDLPIGRPIANTRAYVLDLDLQPVPVGMPGELYIGSIGVSRGYLNRPDLTAEKFIPDPFSHESGARLYKTGDIVRYRPDGNIEFVGRIDDQVKIQGFRVEPGEIEAILAQHPDVQEVVVLARQDTLEQKYLVAYVIPNQEATLSMSDLRAFLKSKLPEYMMPSAFILLDALPMTPNGKVDRRALPVPDQTRSELGATFVPPRSHLELQLSHIWEAVLNIRPISLTDDFFDLGGHSLLAVRLTGRIREQFGRDLPLATLFEASTIAQLADVLRQESDVMPRSTLVTIQPNGSKPPFFCVHAIGGEVLNFIDLARHLGPDQPFYGLQALRPEEAPDDDASIEEIAAHYLDVIQEVQPEGPYLLGGLSAGGIIALEMAQQLHRRGGDVALLVLLDTWSPTILPPYTDDAQLLAEQAQYMARVNGKHLSLAPEELRPLGWDEQLGYVLERAKQAGLVPPELELEWLRRYAQGYRNRARAFHNYVPQAYPGRITLFRARDHNAEQFRSFEERGMDTDDPTQGWGEVASGGLENIVTPGYHETMCLEPHVQVLTERLRGSIERALASLIH